MTSKGCASGHRFKFHFAYPVYISTNRHFSLHAHVHHELVIVQHGRFRSRVGEEEYVVFPGDILLYTARTAHEEWAEGGKPVLTWVCAFDYDGFGPDEPVFRWDAQCEVQELVAYLTELHYIDIDHKETRRHTIEAPPVLATLVAALERLKGRESHAMVDRVRAFIRAGMTESITVADLAELAGLTKFHFARRYRELTGRSPMEDLRLMRLEEARRLIVTTDLPLYEIAPRVGISSEYYLSRQLKEHLGVGVRELRPSGL